MKIKATSPRKRGREVAAITESRGVDLECPTHKKKEKSVE